MLAMPSCSRRLGKASLIVNIWTLITNKPVARCKALGDQNMGIFIEILVLLGVVAAAFILKAWVLPRLGVKT
jgi:hypothetical protein